MGALLVTVESSGQLLIGHAFGIMGFDVVFRRMEGVGETLLSPST